jgi:DeoR family transcriptional regulator of aga operon
MLLERVRAEGHADAASLARDLRVDGSTIRRDLARLEQAGLIRRTRGGALPNDPSEVIDIPYEMRRAERQAAKRAIAHAAAALVKNGQTVILDNGSTTHQVAHELRYRQNLTIITNDLLIGLVVARQPTNRLHMTGGVVLNSLYTLAGPQAVAAFDNLHADWLFIGAEGIHPDAGVTNINVVEIPTKLAMMSAAEKVVFVADSSKFGRRAFAQLCRLSDATNLLTDDELPLENRAAYGARLRCVPLIPPVGTLGAKL